MKKRLLHCFLFIHLGLCAQTIDNYTCITERVEVSKFTNGRLLDKNGIIKTTDAYHPLMIAQYGVMCYREFLNTGDSLYYQKCIDQYNYFSDTTKVNLLFDGKGIGLPYNKKFWDLKAPWYSGMTQGYAVSYLLRYYDLTKNTEALDIAKKVMYFLLQPQEKGGTISKTPQGYVWIEEYPNSKKSPQVLNGYINGLIGLKEYLDFFPEDALAKKTFDATYKGLLNSLEYYDTPTWSMYNRNNKKLTNLYLRYQITEMEQLYNMFNEELFDKQRRIYCVMAYNKFNKSKAGYYKRPNHTVSLQAQQLDSTTLGLPLSSKDISFIPVQDSIRVYKSEKKLKKGMNKKISTKLNKKRKSAFYHFKNSNPNNANMLSLTFDEMFSDDAILRLYYVQDGQINDLPFEYDLYANSASVYYIDPPAGDIVVSVKNKNKLSVPRAKFLNYDKNEAPHYVFHKVPESFSLTKDKRYKINLMAYETNKAIIYYKHAKNKELLVNSKWKAKNTTKDILVPKEDGEYEFMVVFDADSPLSAISKFELIE